MLATSFPFPFFIGLDGSPLDAGSIYYGLENQNPVTAPVQVFWDAAGTQPAVQPIRTLNGFASRSGSPALIYLDGAYSVLVRDGSGRTVFYAPTSTAFDASLFIASAVGAIPRSVQEKLRDLQAPGDMGVWVDDGATNCGAALLAFLNNGGGTISRPGTYLVGNIAPTAPHRVLQMPGVIIKRHPSAGANWIQFNAATSGSEWSGFTIDCNKAAAPGATATAVRIGDGVTGPSGLKLLNGLIRNAPGAPILSTDTAGLRLYLDIEDCDGSVNLARDSDGADIRLRIFRTNNSGKAIFQHAFDAQQFNNADIDVENTDQTGDASGLSNASSGLTMIGNTGCRCTLVDNGHLSTGVFTLGVSCSGGRGNTYRLVSSVGNRTGLEMVGESDGVVETLFIDGVYVTTAASPSVDSIAGVVCHSGGLYSPGGISQSVSTARRMRFLGGVVKRCGTGVRLRGGGVNFDDVHVTGSSVDAFRANKLTATSGFPGAVAENIESFSFTNGTLQTSGRAGAMLDECYEGSFAGTRMQNNGQNTANATELRAGLSMQLSNPKRRLSLAGAMLVDTQAFTKNLALSYQPGTTDAANRYTFSLLTPGRIEVGQRLTLVSVLTGPADVIGTVVDMSLDEMIIGFSGAQTFIDSLNSVTGTVSSSGTALTGAGTLFTSEFIGRIWIKSPAGEYRQVMRVTSDTACTINAAFTTPLVGATIQRVRASINGIPSQQYGAWYDSDTEDMITDGVLTYGNVRAGFMGEVSLASHGAEPVAIGQRLTLYAQGAFAAGAGGTTLYGSVPVGYEIVSYRMLVAETISGLTGATMTIGLTGGVTLTLDSGLATVVNTKSQNAIAPVLVTANTFFGATFSGGADNTPDGVTGTFRAELLVRRVALDAFPDV